MSNSRFTPSQPQIWSGKYKRVPGDNTAFHVSQVNGQWHPNASRSIGAETAQCNMVASGTSTALASAVIDGKRYLGGNGGGSFLINEFGQVLVPAQNWTAAHNDHVAIVGSFSGSLLLHDPFIGNDLVDFSATSHLQLGSVWERPYIGIPYNLSRRNEIYFWGSTSTGNWKNLPPVEDTALINAIRQVRPTGAVRFLVSYGGIVLTKIPIGDLREELWEPRYVTQIDNRRWFSKEA